MRATHENDDPGEVIYYLGIIDCLTHVCLIFTYSTSSKLIKVQYGFIKKAEHIWKGLSAPKNEISVNPPGSYGERFLRFISSVVKSPEEATRDKEARRQSNPEGGQPIGGVEDGGWAEGGERDGANESNMQQRKSSTMRAPSSERPSGATILPIVEEAAEGSTGGRSLSRNGSGSDSGVEESAALSPLARKSGLEEDGKGRYAKPLPDRPFQITHKYQNPEDLSFRVATVSS